MNVQTLIYNLHRRQIPQLKQRIAGKSLPTEKFAVVKAARYFEQGNRLTLLAYVSILHDHCICFVIALFRLLAERLMLETCWFQELMYVWNGFAILAKNPSLLTPIIETFDRTLKQLTETKGVFEMKPVFNAQLWQYFQTSAALSLSLSILQIISLRENL